MRQHSRKQNFIYYLSQQLSGFFFLVFSFASAISRKWSVSQDACKRSAWTGMLGLLFSIQFSFREGVYKGDVWTVRISKIIFSGQKLPLHFSSTFWFQWMLES